MKYINLTDAQAELLTDMAKHLKSDNGVGISDVWGPSAQTFIPKLIAWGNLVDIHITTDQAEFQSVTSLLRLLAAVIEDSPSLP